MSSQLLDVSDSSDAAAAAADLVPSEERSFFIPSGDLIPSDDVDDLVHSSDAYTAAAAADLIPPEERSFFIPSGDLIPSDVHSEEVAVPSDDVADLENVSCELEEDIKSRLIILAEEVMENWLSSQAK
jgi:hypothetical protein